MLALGQVSHRVRNPALLKQLRCEQAQARHVERDSHVAQRLAAVARPARCHLEHEVTRNPGLFQTAFLLFFCLVRGLCQIIPPLAIVALTRVLSLHAWQGCPFKCFEMLFAPSRASVLRDSWLTGQQPFPHIHGWLSGIFRC